MNDSPDITVPPSLCNNVRAIAIEVQHAILAPEVKPPRDPEDIIAANVACREAQCDDGTKFLVAALLFFWAWELGGLLVIP